ncbi:ATP-binding cassette domain-containing protein [Amedibacillus sp. YH-ame10]
MNAITVKNISKKFNERTLFHDFSYEFECEKLYAITGESGSGKSTLLHMIGGLENFDSGEILFHENRNIKSREFRSHIWRDEVAFLFQNYALVDNETVYQNLRVPLDIQKEKNKDEKIKGALHDVGLEDYEERTISSLSGGEQQRVAMARVLLKKCCILLADEPTGNLDAYNKEIIFSLLKQLKQKGKTIIMVTHDSSLASQCDAIIELKK